jgi:hypothetical protein
MAVRIILAEAQRTIHVIPLDLESAELLEASHALAKEVGSEALRILAETNMINFQKVTEAFRFRLEELVAAFKKDLASDVPSPLREHIENLKDMCRK